MGVKTAISLPDGVYRSADALARRLGVSRSRLYATAVAEFSSKYGQDEGTDRLGESRGHEASGLDTVLGWLQGLARMEGRRETGRREEQGVRAVTIRTLKSRLSEYVRLAAQGEVILVTERERVVAELRPPWREAAPWAGGAGLAEAVRRGWVSPPRDAAADFGKRAPVAKRREVLEDLDRDRESR